MRLGVLLAMAMFVLVVDTSLMNVSIAEVVGGAIMLATLSFAFTHQVQDSAVIPPAQQEHITQVLEHDAEVMRNTDLQLLLAGEPPAVQAEIIQINTDARPLALQIALLIPILAGLLGSSTRSG